MTRLEIRPFSGEYLAVAGELLAARHRAHRRLEPLLPPRYEEAAAATAELAALASADAASGAVALRDGRLVGYLLGTPKPDPRWGENVWVEVAGHAVEETEDLRDLYAAAAERWFEDGRVRHYVLVPAHDPALVDTWSRVGFGQQHAYGIRQDPSKPEIGDVVAERDGRVVGAFQLVPVELSSVHSGLARPEGAALLAWAATEPDVRGSGAGVALTQAAFAWASERGYETMVTDWRVTNLLASRFWPARGFRETFLRLYRHLP